MTSGLLLPFEAEPVRTERLLLRPLQLDDAEDHARYQGDPEAVRYLRWPVRTPTCCSSGSTARADARRSPRSYAPRSPANR